MHSHYNHTMEILIPGALPPAAIAPELTRYLESACPSLIERFNTSRARILNLHPDRTGCTPFEALELERKGFQTTGANLSEGLGPLRAGVQRKEEKVWIAELSSVAIAAEGPSLLEPDSLCVTQAESDALFDAVADLWAGSAISALPLNQTRWRIWLPCEPVMNSISPQAIAGMAMADWWSQHETLRSWRKLLNEIQMVWHSHPVNAERALRGLPPVNNLWLYGGAHGWVPENSKEITVFDLLTISHRQSDWATWISLLPALSAFVDSQPQDAVLTLLGQHRGVELSVRKKIWWHHILPAKKNNWKLWWNLQN